MAWIEQQPSGNYLVCFRLNGKRFKRSLKTQDKDEADILTSRLEGTLLDIERGKRDIPPNVDLVTFLLSDGRVVAALDVPDIVTLKELFNRYFQSITPGSLEESTIYGMKLHRKKLEKHLRATFPVQSLSRVHLESYVAKRASSVSGATIKKEVVTLRTVWNWGVHSNLVSGPFPGTGLKYPKIKEKPPFMSFQEVEEQSKGLSEEDASELWESVYLTTEDLDALLEHVEKSSPPFIYPMFVFAAHTGARRSELMRARIQDVDLKKAWVTIHERKKAHDKKTTRRVPLSAKLIKVLSGWLVEHPGGQSLFCHAAVVARSKMRSSTTGHQGKKRATTISGRTATVGERANRLAIGPLTRDEMHDHFKRAVAGTKWARLKGWHVLRHSFNSCLAAKGVDQRVIDDFVGHCTDEQRRRYRHLVAGSITFRHSVFDKLLHVFTFRFQELAFIGTFSCIPFPRLQI